MSQYQVYLLKATVGGSEAVVGQALVLQKAFQTKHLGVCLLPARPCCRQLPSRFPALVPARTRDPTQKRRRRSRRGVVGFKNQTPTWVANPKPKRRHTGVRAQGHTCLHAPPAGSPRFSSTVFFFALAPRCPVDTPAPFLKDIGFSVCSLIFWTPFKTPLTPTIMLL